MVRILHTADVHLTPDAEERLAAMESVVSIADAENVDLLTIGGDLFDTEVAAERLRGSLRDLFSDRNYPILTIPGNHDAEAFRRNLVFGENFTPATQTPFDHYVVGDELARVTCLPYTAHPTDDLLIDLANRDPFEGPEFLLLHCSLEAPIHGDVGDEGEQRYFPIKTQALAELDFDYYLAGHFHSSHITELSNGGTFAYPGSPASVTRKETDRRTVLLVDTDASRAIQPRHLDTFHYDRLSLRVTPGAEEDVLDRVRSQVSEWGARHVAPAIAVDGFTEWNEAEFDEALAEASGAVPVDNDTRSVDYILANPLFETFQVELQAREELRSIEERDDYDIDRFKDEVWEQTLAVFVDLAAEGKLA